jgi:putative component of toxin-antitoxin plasmid stabilization module
VYEIRRSTAFDAWLTNLNDTDRVLYLLLCGGTKATQDADIKRAIEMNAARAREVSAARQRRPKKRK